MLSKVYSAWVLPIEAELIAPRGVDNLLRVLFTWYLPRCVTRNLTIFFIASTEICHPKILSGGVLAQQVDLATREQ